MGSLSEHAESPGQMRFPLDREETLIGRDGGCDIVIPVHTVSRRHARILHTDNGWLLEDLHSRNGTFVNGERVGEPRVLHEGDLVEFDVIRLVFRVDQETGEAALVTPETAARPPEEAPPPARAGAGNAEIHLPAGVMHRVSEYSAAKLSALFTLLQSVGPTLDLDEVLSRLLDGLFKIFPQAERGYILLADGPSGLWGPQAVKSIGDPEGRVASPTIAPISRSLATRAMSEATAILQTSGSDDAAEAVFDGAFRSLMCAPLEGSDGLPIGVISLETEEPRQPFTEVDLDLLANAAILAGFIVAQARRHQAELSGEQDTE